MSIASEITRLQNIKAAIRQALVNKGIAAASSHDMADFATDIGNISTGITPSGTIQITANNTYDVTNYASAVVNVSNTPVTQEKTVTPSASAQEVTPDSGKYLSKVTVNATPLETKSVTPSASAQTVTPSSGKVGLSQVNVAAAPLETKSVTPSASQQTITPSSGIIGMSQVTVAGDANLVAGNIKSGVSIFGVNGTYAPSATPVNGSLIEVTCSSNIDTVTATVNGNTYTGVFVSGTAYVTIPYTDTTVARTCVLKAYYNGSQMTSTQVAMSAGIGYYTAYLETSQRLYYYGTWYGVSGQTWTKTVAISTVTDSSSGLSFYCPNGNYTHIFTLSPNIDTRGYKHFKIRGTVTGGVNGLASQQTRGNSYIQIGSQFINFPNQNSGTNTFTITSEKHETASDDATLTVHVLVPMGYAPATILIQEIEFV